MGSELFNNYKNIIWKIESITPTFSIAGVKSKFFHINDDEAENLAGYDRSFRLKWKGGGPQMGVSSFSARETLHDFTLEVYYNALPKRQVMNEMVLKDIHDLVWALENEDSYIGYDSSNTSTDIGLQNRHVVKSSLTEDNETWILQLEIETTIDESNY